VSFEPNVSQSRLLELYSQASLFWHATGFGRPDAEPEKAEHFGITTVEAMSRGAVPMVYPDGVHVEIATERVGLLWRTPEELARLAENLIASPHRLDTLSRSAAEVGLRYGRDTFYESCRNVFG